jgi:hypothetical protein
MGNPKSKKYPKIQKIQNSNPKKSINPKSIPKNIQKFKKFKPRKNPKIHEIQSPNPNLKSDFFLYF